ncbi:hypothetical protein FACS189452_05440 [Bacteroidia bacterium]|nr:hypothetical protein FACS189452_05440 [Bacteroidia bacterium]GHT81464.1 hypothetical protein FACS189467_5570 [Bacteroidia bacterium]
MELKKIRALVANIRSDIEKNKFAWTFRKYDTFFGELGMLNKRGFFTLKRIDSQLKKHHITLWIGKEPIKNLKNVPKGETITFRLDNNNKNTTIQAKTKYQWAGTIHIATDESGIEPYEHQKKAFYELQNAIIKSNKNPFAGLLVLPTGGGKTLTAAHWISKNFLDKGKKILWIAHRHELLEQAQKTFTEKLAFKDIFATKQSFNYRILSGRHDKPVHIQPTDDIIFASKDSLNAGFDYLLKNWIKNNTDEVFLVVDEAHHAAAKTYRKLITRVKDSVSQFRMLGLTATPFRTAENERGFLHKVFPDDIVYKIDLRTLQRLGILSDAIFEKVDTKQNYELTQKQIDEINSKFGDVTTILGERIANSIANNKERNFTIVNHYISQKEKYGKTIVFAWNVDNAIALNALFRQAGIKSNYVVSDVRDSATGITISSTENKNKIDQFRKGELDILINVQILTEGTDVPDVQSVFLTRPTTSTILMTQMVGRGLRGTRAGGTEKAYIVNFADDWGSEVLWVNPEKLFIDENVDFADRDNETTKRFIRLIAIGKIEEFAILNNQIIEPEVKNELEKLDFTERIPIGIYQFKYLVETKSEPKERQCDILVYDNLLQSYRDFVNDLPALFAKYKLVDKDFLTEKELDYYFTIVEDEYFNGCLKYPAYLPQDIKDILQYYAMQDQTPPFIECKEREKYDIDKIARDIIAKDLGAKAQTELTNTMWENEEFAWQTFFNFDKKIFLHEIDLSKTKQMNPDLYKRQTIVPQDEKELRKIEKLSLYDLRQVNPAYEKHLRDKVFRKFTDADGYYFSAKSGYRSKNKLDFQVDHINPMAKGGLTVLDNLQLLTRAENAIKGAK